MFSPSYPVFNIVGRIMILYTVMFSFFNKSLTFLTTCYFASLCYHFSSNFSICLFIPPSLIAIFSNSIFPKLWNLQTWVPLSSQPELLWFWLIFRSLFLISSTNNCLTFLANCVVSKSNAQHWLHRKLPAHTYSCLQVIYCPYDVIRSIPYTVHLFISHTHLSLPVQC